ncbi:TonB-dependent receptor [Sphingomonas immobilis]|uniref:TonB-dependent receptor n=1 Tax=Sphingomonas immobilis TaxID=3063997 RepID=A0ABT8ZTC4_9SPHN|nr:TonB-dependent receptor [Sphingomonas sp. CA1-15]MDO7840808.1 TonB-dependent receptor [Sphingomonas sp. CA1-15]
MKISFSARVASRLGGALLLSTSLIASVAHAAPAPADAAAPADADVTDQSQDIVVVGSGETRSVQTLLPQNLDVLPPGTSVQKALNFLPGVMAQSIDALGVNEQSLSLQVRGFNTTHLGYTLDGMPLGDGAYNNYNGLTISRALISENLGRADLATGIAGLAIASTSNLGGAVIYTSSDPSKEVGLRVSQTVGSENSLRTYARLDTGDMGGLSAYISGQYTKQDLFVNQGTGKTSTGEQINAKIKYENEGFTLTAYADISRTNQADDAYISKEILGRRGYDLGGYAPDWTSYLQRNACTVTTTPVACVPSTLPEKIGDVTYTNGQILRSDDLFYIAADFKITEALSARAQVYRHTDGGAGNNFITGLSNQGTASTADDLPVQIRDTRYTIDRTGALGNVSWHVGFNHFEAGFWVEENTSSAARYIRTDVTGPIDLGQFLQGQPATAQWVQETQWTTRQFFVQDTMKFLNDTLSVDFGFKGTYSRSDARAIPGVAKAAPPASTQFATGSLVAEDYFLPEAGIRWEVAQGHELFASYAENIAMYQGGFKLGPQSVSQAVWDVQGKTLKPETSRSFEGGYRFVSRGLQVSLTGYWVDFNNRLLQYNPCPTAQQQNPGCGNSFHNAGSVTSKGVELGVLWKPLPFVTWYNSVSYNESTYNEDLNFCTATCILYPTAGKQQVDTPKWLASSVLTAKYAGFTGSLSGKYTGERFYTYTNDQGFPGYFTMDLGLSYDVGNIGPLKSAKLSLNVTNLTNLRYASNFDNSVFAPTDPTGTIIVFHSSAPRQFFGTLSVAF